MTGQIPKYGEWFRHELLTYEPGELASRRYVLKADPDWWIRSSRSSEQWWVFCLGAQCAGPFPVMREAMARCRELATVPVSAAAFTVADVEGDAPGWFARVCGAHLAYAVDELAVAVGLGKPAVVRQLNPAAGFDCDVEIAARDDALGRAA